MYTAFINEGNGKKLILAIVASRFLKKDVLPNIFARQSKK